MASTWSCGRRREAALALNSVPRYSDGFHGGISSRMCQAVAGQSSSSARQRLPWAGGVGAAAFRHIASRDFGDSGSPVMASTPLPVVCHVPQGFEKPGNTRQVELRFIQCHVQISCRCAATVQPPEPAWTWDLGLAMPFPAARWRFLR